ncbi:MAG: apolipoprotein N-acyltransferase [bacterium]
MRSKNLKIAVASICFLASFALSFPFVIPGTPEPVFLHQAIGWIFIFFVMPSFLYVIESFNKLSHKIGMLYLLCIPANGLVFYWAYYSIHVYGGVPQFYTILIIFLMFTALSTFWLFFLLLYEFFKKDGSIAPWKVAVAWVVAETVRTFFPVDFYWSCLGHSQYNNKLTLQWASIGAIYLISFMIVWISVYVFSKLRGAKNWKEGVVLLVVTTLLITYSTYRIEKFSNLEPSKEVKVAIMQPAINQFDINSKERSLEDIIDVLTEQINSFDKDTELLIWHEAALPLKVPVGFDDFGYAMEKYFPRATRFENQIVGIDMIDREKGEFYNSGGFIKGDKIEKIYRKIKLAPFGEYLPMSDFLRNLGFSTIVPNTIGTFMRGEEHTVFDFGKFKASILICYDGTFSENVREFVKDGAELLVNISNDAWFGYSSEITQHGSFYPFRAVETGRTIARASNVGISEIILPDGTRQSQTSLFKRTTINRKIPLYQYDTIYLKYGNWFLYLLLATAFLITAKRVVEKTKTENPSELPKNVKQKKKRKKR